ncbi:MAG TPA: DUF2130 domain-containing protein [Hyphomicrobiaceae bacterium]|nr:DUF2130 domain-containing protein [Hyphomicrobiaceae bacterium]
MASLPFQGFRSAPQHVHISGERCPWCDQAIPHDKFDEISNRIAAREREQLAIITKDLKDQFAREKAEIEAKAAAAAGARLQAKLAEIERANSAAVGEVQAQLGEAERARAEAERAAETLRAAQEARLGELREALEKQRTAAVLAEQAKSFEERQKLHEKVQELQRQLENKTAQELGEGAEIDLLDELKAHFEGDRFSHVGKGAQGADIIHEVVHNGKVCGKIIYDAKNRNAWRSEYVTKLRQDQLDEKADHAILSSRAFPAGARQLASQDGVIIANPGRVVVVAGMLRRHILNAHELRVSSQEREQKTAALYDFMTSERCRQLLDSVETQTTRMLELEQAEEKAHRLTWERRGRLIRSVHKVHGDLCSEIERIIGTAQEAPRDGSI